MWDISGSAWQTYTKNTSSAEESPELRMRNGSCFCADTGISPERNIRYEISNDWDKENPALWRGTWAGGAFGSTVAGTAKGSRFESGSALHRLSGSRVNTSSFYFLSDSRKDGTGG